MSKCIAGQGLTGDRYFGHQEDYKGQVTFFALETYEEPLPHLWNHRQRPECFRRNMITRGVDLNQWIGQEFEIQGVSFAGTEEAAPVSWMNHAFAPGAGGHHARSGAACAPAFSQMGFYEPITPSQTAAHNRWNGPAWPSGQGRFRPAEVR